MKVQELTLDCSKWRCGGFGKNTYGQGSTALLNKEGFMCCLGQFGEQLGVPEDLLLDHHVPSEIDEGYQTLYEQAGLLNDSLREESLSDTLVAINDNSFSTPEEKIEQIKETLSKEGITLRVINEEAL